MIAATVNAQVVDLCCGMGGLSVAAAGDGDAGGGGAREQVFGCRCSVVGDR